MGDFWKIYMTEMLSSLKKLRDLSEQEKGRHVRRKIRILFRLRLLLRTTLQQSVLAALRWIQGCKELL